MPRRKTAQKLGHPCSTQLIAPCAEAGAARGEEPGPHALPAHTRSQTLSATMLSLRRSWWTSTLGGPGALALCTSRMRAASGTPSGTCTTRSAARGVRPRPESSSPSDLFVAQPPGHSTATADSRQTAAVQQDASQHQGRSLPHTGDRGPAHLGSEGRAPGPDAAGDARSSSGCRPGRPTRAYAWARQVLRAKV
jgi:hypothetical protein